MSRSELLDMMDPDSIIRIHSASDEDAACIQTQPTAPHPAVSGWRAPYFSGKTFIAALQMVQSL